MIVGEDHLISCITNNRMTRGQPQQQPHSILEPCSFFLYHSYQIKWCPKKSKINKYSYYQKIKRGRKMALLVPSMATQKPPAFVTKTSGYKKAATMKGAGTRSTTTSNIKLLTNVEKLKLLTKAEKAGLLSAAEKAGFSLSSIEKLGLLSKAEELGVLSAATDPSTPSALLTLSLALLALGPFLVFLVPEEYPWEIGLQVAVALVSVVGGSAAFAASNFVSNLQKSS